MIVPVPNANSALIVTVTPEDFPQPGTLGGVTFQRQLEEAAYRCGGGKIPVQLYGDFRENRISTGFGAVTPQFEGQFAFGNLREGAAGSAFGSDVRGNGTFWTCDSWL